MSSPFWNSPNRVDSGQKFPGWLSHVLQKSSPPPGSSRDCQSVRNSAAEPGFPITVVGPYRTPDAVKLSLYPDALYGWVQLWTAASIVYPLGAARAPCWLLPSPDRS